MASILRVDSVVDADNSASLCPIIKLPNELLLSIADYLSPASQVLTALSCKALYDALRQRSRDERRKLSRQGHNEYLLGVLDRLGLHDRLVCMVCHRLHDAESHDIPGTTKGLTFYGCWPIGAKVANMSKYCLHQRHVQLALRYSQSGAREKQLEKLLEPYYDSGSATFAPMFRETVALPLIADGHYLLQVHERFKPLYHAEVTMGQCQFLEICPHTGTSPRFSDHISHWQLREALASAISRPGVRCEGWCRDCATAFAVLITDFGLEVDAWYDFGSDPSPSSPYWISHVDHTYVDNKNAELAAPFPGTQKLRTRFEQARDIKFNN